MEARQSYTLSSDTDPFLSSWELIKKTSGNINQQKSPRQPRRFRGQTDRHRLCGPSSPDLEKYSNKAEVVFSPCVSHEDSLHPVVSDPMLKPSLLNFCFHKQHLSSSCYLKVAHSRGLALLTAASVGLNQARARRGGHSPFTKFLLCLWSTHMTDNTGSHLELCQSK